MHQLNQLLPEIGLTAFAILVLMADPFLRGRQGRALYYIGILSAALALALVGLSYSAPQVYQGVAGLWVVDPMSLYFKVLILATALLTLFMSAEYGGPIEAHKGSYTALILLACVGMMLLVSSTDLLMIFLSLELVSICSFILVGFERAARKSSEGAVKYYLMGAFSSAVMVYGISLFYGATGTTKLAGIPPILAQGREKEKAAGRATPGCRTTPS
jgi:NADH-quinone oxidoreductase subunit N